MSSSFPKSNSTHLDAEKVPSSSPTGALVIGAPWAPISLAWPIGSELPSSSLFEFESPSPIGSVFPASGSVLESCAERLETVAVSLSATPRSGSARSPKYQLKYSGPYWASAPPSVSVSASPVASVASRAWTRGFSPLARVWKFHQLTYLAAIGASLSPAVSGSTTSAASLLEKLQLPLSGGRCQG
ncbi:hypothetical protein BDW74DRAFT_95497 [Aspergillus multicolor]|uniref:uncharacterized protein n=1 Tax=Aspergillus multicolor TaxID=41759 RepID=UPI003CCCB28A